MFDDLRISILLIGTFLVMAIYLWDRWKEYRARKSELLKTEQLSADLTAPVGDEHWEIVPLLRDTERGAPVEDAQLREFAGIKNSAPNDDAEAGSGIETVAQNVEPKTVPSSKSPAGEILPERLLALTVFTQEDNVFTGPGLSDLFDRLDLHYGEMKIFHYIDKASGESVFSLASIIEPGYFDLETLHELRTPGLALFMRLPGPLDGKAAFDAMYATAREIAALKEGLIGDQARNMLSTDALSAMRSEAARYPAQSS